MKHCCSKMEGTVEEKNHSVSYEDYTRTYHVNVGQSFINEDTGEVEVSVVDRITYCPWCGKKLPKSLRSEWYDEIENLGIELPLDNEKIKKLPKEYQTEEWWKKKGV